MNFEFSVLSDSNTRKPVIFKNFDKLITWSLSNSDLKSVLRNIVLQISDSSTTV
jgi:hypothetical protein